MQDAERELSTLLGFRKVDCDVTAIKWVVRVDDVVVLVLRVSITARKWSL